MDDLRSCPACADSRISIQSHDGWCWVTCATCHYRGPAMRDVVSAIAEYNAQRGTIAQYTVPRSELATITAERDALSAQLAALKKRVADAPKGETFTSHVFVEELCAKDQRVIIDVDCFYQEGVRVALVRLEDEE